MIFDIIGLGPGHLGALPRRLELEVGHVVGFVRTLEVKLHGDEARLYFHDLLPACANFVIAVPLIDSADAGWRAGIIALHRGIKLLPGRPFAEAFEIRHKGGDLRLRRRYLDRAGIAEVIGLQCRIAKDAHNGENNDDEQIAQQLEHPEDPPCLMHSPATGSAQNVSSVLCDYATIKLPNGGRARTA
jgi:hypothetical protein